MKYSQKQFIKKLKQQQKTNPGNKNIKYEQPIRPRSASFKDITKYNRARHKQNMMKNTDD